MFKKGEKVRCIKDDIKHSITDISYKTDSFTKGNIYIVKSIDKHNKRFMVEKDDFGRCNGWIMENFESIEKELFYKEILE